MSSASRRESSARSPLPSLSPGELTRMIYLADHSNLTEDQLAARYGISPALTKAVISGRYRARK